MSAIVYTSNNKLFVHTLNIMHNGKLLIINNKNNIVKTIKLANTDFYTCVIDFPPGKYLIRLESENGIETKYINTENKNLKQKKLL